MSQLEIRLADDDASAANSSGSTQIPGSGESAFFATPPRRGPILGASLSTVIWLALCSTAFILEMNLRDISSYPIADLLVWLIAGSIPVGAFWLIAFSVLQTRTLKASASALQHNFAAFTFPTEDAQRRFATVINALRQQTRDLGLASQKANERIQAMESLFREQTTRLQHAADVAEERTGRIKTMLERQEAALTDIADQVGEKVKNVEDVVSEGARELAKASENVSRNAQEANDLLSKQTEDLGKASSAAAETSREVQETIASSVGDLQLASENAKRTAESLEGSYRSQFDEIQKRSDTLAENAEALRKTLEQEVDTLGVAGEQAAERARIIEETVQSHAAELNKVVEETKNRAAEVASQFKQDIGGTADLTHSAIESLHQGASDAAGQIREAGREFVDHAASMRSTADLATSDMTAAGSRLKDSAAEILSLWRSATQKTVGHAEDSLKAFTLRAEDFQHTTEALKNQLLEQVDEATEKLESGVKDVSEAAAVASSRTEDAGKALLSAKEDLRAAAQESKEVLDTTGAILRQQTATLGQTAAAAAESAQTVSTTYSEGVERLDTASSNARQNTEQLRDQLQTLTDQMRGLAAEIGLKAEEVENRLNSQMGTWNSVSAQTAEDIERIETSFGTTADGLIAASEKAGERVLTAGREILEKVEVLRGSSRESAATLGTAVSHLEEGARAVSESSQAAVSRLESVRAAIDEHDHSARSAADSAATRLLRVGEILETVTGKVSEVSDNAAGRMTEATGTLKDQGAEAEAIADQALKAINAVTDAFKIRLEELDLAARETGSNIENSGSAFAQATGNMAQSVDQLKHQTATLTEGAQRMVEAATKVSDRASKADHVFEARSQRLLRSADQLSETIRALEELEQETTQGAFLRTANNIMESLGSLAVDIDRIIEIEVPDKVWRQYRAGDSSVFARRLVSMASRATRKKIADKYRGESEFRDHVLRYLRQFESLLKRAVTIERSDALAATLLSSNMGKLYVLLAQSLNRLR